MGCYQGLMHFDRRADVCKRAGDAAGYEERSAALIWEDFRGAGKGSRAVPHEPKATRGGFRASSGLFEHESLLALSGPIRGIRLSFVASRQLISPGCCLVMRVCYNSSARRLNGL